MNDKPNMYHDHSGNADMQFSMHATSQGYTHTAGGHVHTASDLHIVSTHSERTDTNTQQVHTDTREHVKGHLLAHPASHRGSALPGACLPSGLARTGRESLQWQ